MERRLIGLSLVVMAVLFTSLIGRAAPSGVTYQGRILKPNGEPLTGSNVQFRMQIRAPDANSCLMYEELQAQNMSGSGGSFSLTINDGSGVRQDITGLGLDRVFANRGTLNFDPATCASGNSYIAGTGDGRVLQVYFKDETMATWEPMPPQKINFVPFAFEAKQVAGFSAENLLRFAESDGTLVNTTPLNNAQYTELLSLVNGTSTAYERAGRLGGVALPTLGAGQAGQVLGWNGTAWETTDTVPTNSIATGKIQDNAVTSDKIANGTIVGADLANNIAITTTSTIQTSGTVSSNISTSRDVRIYDTDATPNENYVSLKVPASLSQNYNYVWPGTYGLANQVLTSDGAGNLTWAAPSAATQWSNGSGGAIYYNGGSVGIGTATPSEIFHVVKDQNATTQVRVGNGDTGATAEAGFSAITSGSQGQLLAFGSGRSNANWIRPSGVALVTSSGSSGGLAIAARNATSGNITFHAGGDAERVRIDTAGNLGIGTTAPGSALQIGGSASTNNITADYVGTAALLKLRFAAGERVVMSSDGGQSFGASYPFNAGTIKLSNLTTSSYISTGASGALLLNPAAGNVGIGITSPAYKLDVAGAVNATSLKINGVDVAAGGTPGGATTQVQYNNAGAFAGSADFVFDATNGRLGLNSTPATHALQVVPKAGFEAALFKGNASNKDVQVKIEGYDGTGRQIVEFNRPGTSQHSIGIDGSDNFYFGIGANINIPSQDLINMAPNGNVSIGKGTTAPSGKLDVKGSIVMSGATSGYAGFRVPAAAGSSVWQLPAADGVSGQALVTDGSGALSWNSMASSNYWTKTINDISYSGGNVGIGTATPARNLDVVGTIGATSTISGFNFSAISSGSFTPLVSYNNAAPANEKYWDFFHNGSQFSLRMPNDAYNASQNAMTFTRTGTTLTSVSFPQGSVGIGVASPTQTLDVNGTAKADSYLIASGVGNSAQATNSRIRYNAGVAIWESPASTAIVIDDNNDSTDATFSVLKDDGAVSLLHVMESGNVGIGTTAPGAMLQLGTPATSLGTFRLAGSTSGYVQLQPAAAAGSWTMTLPATAGTADQVLTTNGAGVTTWSTVSAGGSGDFKADGTVPMTGQLRAADAVNAAAPDFTFVGDADTGMYHPAANAVALSTSGVERLRVAPSGSVGIGTVAPTSLLEVVSTAQTKAKIASTATNNEAVLTLVSNEAAGANASNVSIGATSSPFRHSYILNYNDTPLLLSTQNTARIRVASGTEGGGVSLGSYASGGNVAPAGGLLVSGNVGIGNTAPDSKLHVTGTAHVTGNSTIDGAVSVGASIDANAQHFVQSNPWNTSGEFNTTRSWTIYNGNVNNTNIVSGNKTEVWASKSGSSNVLVGNRVDFQAQNGLGATSSISGSATNVASSSSNSIGDVIAYQGLISQNGTGTISTARGLAVGVNRSTGTITTGYGVYIDSIAGTTNYGLYQANSANQNYFAGNVGVGVAAPTEKLEVSGNVKATSFISTSDARLKKNVVKTPGLDYVRQLTGVQWQWKSDDRTDAGVIAQDVERVMPFAVVTDAKSGYKAVKYNALIAPLIESTKELYGLCKETSGRTQANSRAIASVQAENKELRKENAALKSRLDTMEERLKAIEAKLAK